MSATEEGGSGFPARGALAGERSRAGLCWASVALASVALAACGIDDRENLRAVGPLLPDSGSSSSGGTADASSGCVPGATECRSETESVTCGADRRWGEPVPCASGCVAGSCQTGECAAGSGECLSVTRVHVCSEGGL